METVETIEYRGFNINIYQDESPEDPRDWDNLGTMVCFHSRYTLGDKHEFKTPAEWLYSLLPETDKLMEDYDYNLDDQEFMEKYFDRAHKTHIILPLYLYDHSGITMNTSGFSCPWDSGQVGYISISIKKIKKEYGWKYITKQRRERIAGYLRNEVQTYDEYISGAVYGYQIEPNDMNKGIDCDDSCWGFFGYDWEKNGLLEHAKPEIDYAIKEYKASVIKERDRKREMDTFMKTAWAV